ncbi:MAG: esterase family protein [Candidatus Marinimicrobia bacterium]|nr:esterase family protein [Candidatus Neomarinimicrobiota bacterium]
MKHFLLILTFIRLISCTSQENPIFINFQNKLANISNEKDRQICTDRFLKKLSRKDYPIFENDSTIILLYKGNAEKVEMIGDVNYWTHPSAFTNLAATDLFFLRQKIQKNSLLEYWLIIDGTEIQIDSLNQYKVRNEFGYASQIVAHNNPFYLNQLKKADEKLYKSYLVPIQNNQYVKIHIYFPPDYNDYDHFPLILFLDGKKYIDLGDAPIIINNMISSGKIKKAVAVFAEIGFEENAEAPTIDKYGAISKIIIGPILEFVTSRFNIENNPENRLLVGKSISGGVGFLTVFENPNQFGNVFIQSGYFSADNFFLIQLIEQNYRKNINCYFQIGIYERNVSHMIIPPAETDFYQVNRKFVALLRAKGYPVVLNEYATGHTWGNWKNHLSEGLIYFLGNHDN